MRQLAQMGGNPQDELIDFERAAMNAITIVFPDATVKWMFLPPLTERVPPGMLYMYMYMQDWLVTNGKLHSKLHP